MLQPVGVRSWPRNLYSSGRVVDPGQGKDGLYSRYGPRSEKGPLEDVAWVGAVSCVGEFVSGPDRTGAIQAHGREAACIRWRQLVPGERRVGGLDRVFLSGGSGWPWLVDKLQAVNGGATDRHTQVTRRQLSQNRKDADAMQVPSWVCPAKDETQKGDSTDESRWMNNKRLPEGSLPGLF